MDQYHQKWIAPPSFNRSCQPAFQCVHMPYLTSSMEITVKGDTKLNSKMLINVVVAIFGSFIYVICRLCASFFTLLCGCVSKNLYFFYLDIVGLYGPPKQTYNRWFFKNDLQQVSQTSLNLKISLDNKIFPLIYI